MSSLIRRSIPVLAALMAVACGDSALEPAADSVYVLESANGRALPATLVVSQAGTVVLLSDTLIFRRDDRFERIRWLRTEEQGGGGVVIQREASAGRVVAADGAITLVDEVCLDPGSLALCTEPDTARFEGSTLTLQGPVPPAGRKDFRVAG